MHVFMDFYCRDGPSKEGFSLGKSGNIYEVFGEPSLLMLLPVFTSLGDGLTFPLLFSGDVEQGQGAREAGFTRER